MNTTEQDRRLALLQAKSESFKLLIKDSEVYSAIEKKLTGTATVECIPSELVEHMHKMVVKGVLDMCEDDVNLYIPAHIRRRRLISSKVTRLERR